MIKRLSSVKTPGVIDSSNHGYVSVKEDPLVTICHEGESVGKVLLSARNCVFVIKAPSLSVLMKVSATISSSALES